MFAENLNLLYVVQLSNPSIEFDFSNVSADFDGTTLKIVTNLGKEHYHEFVKSNHITFDTDENSSLVVIRTDDRLGLYSHYESEHEYHMLLLSKVPEEWISLVN